MCLLYISGQLNLDKTLDRSKDGRVYSSWLCDSNFVASLA